MWPGSDECPGPPPGGGGGPGRPSHHHNRHHHPQLRHPISGQMLPPSNSGSNSQHPQHLQGIYVNPRYETQRSRLVSDPSQKILIDYGTDDPLVQSHSSPQHGGHGTDRVDGGGSGGHHAHTHHHMPVSQRLGHHTSHHHSHHHSREDSGGGGGGHHHYTSSRGDPIQVVDLDHDAEISITGQNPSLYLRHASYDAPPVAGVLYNSDRNYRSYYAETMSSDTSSAYSGSETMNSLQSGQEDLDLSGLQESHVDSDEEDLAESIGSFTLRDQVRECLEKDPADRNEEDIEVLKEFTHTLEAFAGITSAVRLKMCAVMVFAVVDKADTIVMNHEEELDSWSVIINGAVRVEGGEGGRNYVLSMGQGFGISPTMKKEFHQGVMTTMVDDCQFICITQSDYYKILHEGKDALVKEEDEAGNLVKVSEVRRAKDGSKHIQVLLRATPEKLINNLIEEEINTSDPNFIEDFLLTHRVFLDSSLIVMNQLLEWFDRADLRDKVTRILLLWVNNHFTDFELDSDMMDLLNQFEAKLEVSQMKGQLRLLNFACAAKARTRSVTLTRPSRDEILEFRLVGGHHKATAGGGIFVDFVGKGSSAAKKGLKRGDQILDVNGQNFAQGMTLERALSILQSQSHLQLNVKSNYLGYKEALQMGSENQSIKKVKKSCDLTYNNRREMVGSPISPPPHSKDDLYLLDKMAAASLHGKAPQRKGSSYMMQKLKDLLRQPKLPTHKIFDGEEHFEAALSSGPDGFEDEVYEYNDSTIPEHSLKIYKADQSCKYLLVNKTTSAKEVVMLALKEFGITEVSTNYALFEVTADNGLIRQRRLADTMDSLAQRIGLASRYYIKNIQSNQQLVPEELSTELQRESVVTLLGLNHQESATQLMVEDFTLFRQIEQTEYVDWLFERNSKFGSDNLNNFSEMLNKETLWVVAEIVEEVNLSKRVKLVKHFVKIAKQCKEIQNYNSMFAITSGLMHNAVLRLRNTWDRVPEKYSKLLDDLQGIMDPSRNFSKYRNMIKPEVVKPPLIPIYPMVSKDLSVIHICNKTKLEGLINFEKMRFVAKEIRNLSNMCSAPLRGIPDTIIAMNEQPVKYATMKRAKGRREQPDARKMYNEALMVRKVKAYLNTIKSTYDEEVLQKFSLEIEPPQVKSSIHVGSSSSLRSGGAGSTSGSQAAVRPPSPTPSRTSAGSTMSDGTKSLASAGGHTKFGASSPEAERKLMSLAESSKRKLTKASKSSYSLSPGPSPVQLRRDGDIPPGPRRVGSGPLITHSTASTMSTESTPSNSGRGPIPVTLSAESSSVSSLPGLRRSSVSSQDEETLRRSDFGLRHKDKHIERKVSSLSCTGAPGVQIDLTGRCSTTSLPSPTPPRPPDYNTTASGGGARSLKTGIRPRVSRTQSRDGGGGSSQAGGLAASKNEEEEETQVSAV